MATSMTPSNEASRITTAMTASSRRGRQDHGNCCCHRATRHKHGSCCLLTGGNNPALLRDDRGNPHHAVARPTVAIRDPPRSGAAFRPALLVTSGRQSARVITRPSRRAVRNPHQRDYVLDRAGRPVHARIGGSIGVTTQTFPHAMAAASAPRGTIRVTHPLVPDTVRSEQAST